MKRTNKDKSDVSEKLRLLRIKAGLSMREVAEALKRPVTTYSNYENVYKKGFLPVEFVQKILPLFTSKGISKSQMLALAGVNDISETQEKNLSHIKSAEDLPKDVPILATEQIEDADFILTNNVIDQCRRPPGIVNNKTVFAIWLPTDKMEPRHLMGNLIIAESLRPATLNDDVVVEIDSRKCFIGKIVARHGDKIEIKQYNPDKNFKLDKTKIKKIYRILSTAELLGV